MDAPRNYLDLPENPTFQEKLNHALAKMFLVEEAFPVYPNAENFRHPAWQNTEEMSRLIRARHSGEDAPDYAIVKVFSVKSADWMEFLDTHAGNSEHEGLVAEVERADGWTGRYCIEITLSDAIAQLQENFD